jgi:hypothetical protein
METLKKYLNKYFPFTHKDKEMDTKVRDLSREEQEYLKGIKEYWEKHKKEEEPQQNDAYASPIDYVLGKFLLDIENELSKNSQRFLAEFVINLRNGLNETQKNDKLCKTTSAANLPLLMN